MNTHRLQGRRVVIGGYGGALAAAVLALAVAACTRTMSLGAAGTPDGSDVHASTDAGDAQPDLPPDVQPDRAPDIAADTASDVVADAGPDVPGDSHMDQNGDGGQNCVDNGITYHSGDVVLCPGCPVSCICTDGTVGDCSSGIPCPVDGSDHHRSGTGRDHHQGRNDVPGDRGLRSTAAGQPSARLPAQANPCPRRRHLVRFRPAHPRSRGSCTTCRGWAISPGCTVACPDAVIERDRRAPAIRERRHQQRPGLSALQSDARLGRSRSRRPTCCWESTTATIRSTPSPAPPPAARSQNNLCCTGASNFPDSCGVGACSCSPTNLAVVDTCVCPSGACFLQSAGCVGPANVCTVGADQTCNDNPGANAFHGTCVTGGHCLCHTGFTIVTASGKCS